MIPRIFPEERGRFALLAFLFFINAFVLESNEVVAISGFISNVGVSQILIVWSTVMLIAILTTGAYSMVVDRVERGRFGVILFLTFGATYVGFYLMLSSGVSGFISYGLLPILNEQQWTVFPLIIWALANDMFIIAEAKRLFPLLAASGLLGSVLGNGVAAGAGQMFSDKGYVLLILNALLMFAGAMVLALALTRIRLTTQRADSGQHFLTIIREGFEFVREVPIFRFLTIAMLLIGVCVNMIMYQLVADLSKYYTDMGQLQTYYGLFKTLMIPLLLILQGAVVTWLLNRITFKSVFGLMPAVTLLSLLLALFWISPISSTVIVTGAIAGNFLVRVTLGGIDEPSRRAFEGLIPDQYRGRVSAFLDGVLYQAGSILGCALIGLVLFAVGQGWLTESAGRAAYLSIGVICAAAALWAITRLYVHYDTSMLSWKLRRRKRGGDLLNQIEF